MPSANTFVVFLTTHYSPCMAWRHCGPAFVAHCCLHPTQNSHLPTWPKPYAIALPPLPPPLLVGRKLTTVTFYICDYTYTQNACIYPTRLDCPLPDIADALPVVIVDLVGTWRIWTLTPATWDYSSGRNTPAFPAHTCHLQLWAGHLFPPLDYQGYDL